ACYDLTDEFCIQRFFGRPTLVQTRLLTRPSVRVLVAGVNTKNHRIRVKTSTIDNTARKIPVSYSKTTKHENGPREALGAYVYNVKIDFIKILNIALIDTT
ncbi:hypothetical protein L9F63_002177, partial [Diploptera punctata]